MKNNELEGIISVVGKEKLEEYFKASDKEKDEYIKKLIKKNNDTQSLLNKEILKKTPSAPIVEKVDITNEVVLAMRKDLDKAIEKMNKKSDKVPVVIQGPVAQPDPYSNMLQQQEVALKQEQDRLYSKKESNNKGWKWFGGIFATLAIVTSLGLGTYAVLEKDNDTVAPAIPAKPTPPEYLLNPDFDLDIPTPPDYLFNPDFDIPMPPEYLLNPDFDIDWESIPDYIWNPDFDIPTPPEYLLNPDFDWESIPEYIWNPDFNWDRLWTLLFGGANFIPPYVETNSPVVNFAPTTILSTSTLIQFNNFADVTTANQHVIKISGMEYNSNERYVAELNIETQNNKIVSYSDNTTPGKDKFQLGIISQDHYNMNMLHLDFPTEDEFGNAVHMDQFRLEYISYDDPEQEITIAPQTPWFDRIGYSWDIFPEDVE